jgi:RNA polymerase sigma-70 factor (ECF subfamily)
MRGYRSEALEPRPACQKIQRGGVLSVNGSSNDLPEPSVLKLADVAAPANDATEHRDRFDELFQHFYPELYGLLFRVLGDRMATEDTLQDVFLKLSDHADVQARPDVEVIAWLRRVGMNVAFNRLRSERRARARVERVGRLELRDADPRDTDAEVLRDEEQMAVRAALAALPERQRECLLLRHSGYSYAEIAATLDIAIGSVGVLLARGEHAFRATYRRQD